MKSRVQSQENIVTFWVLTARADRVTDKHGDARLLANCFLGDVTS